MVRSRWPYDGEIGISRELKSAWRSIRGFFDVVGSPIPVVVVAVLLVSGISRLVRADFGSGMIALAAAGFVAWMAVGVPIPNRRSRPRRRRRTD